LVDKPVVDAITVFINELAFLRSSPAQQWCVTFLAESPTAPNPVSGLGAANIAYAVSILVLWASGRSVSVLRSLGQGEPGYRDDPQQHDCNDARELEPPFHSRSSV
jgi:hypothetical protein